ncbi:MAG TPA: Rrf2 family transcriptional regulator [Noviherbaspirillum sp.]
MTNNGEFMLGNPELHLRLATALSIMTQLICNASHPPSAQQLSDSLEVSVRHLRKLLRMLTNGGLLKPHERHPDTWCCTRPPHTISLADIYCCLAEKEEVPNPYVAPPQAEASVAASELLMMQATMSINQVVFQQLQQFDLGRLKIAESAMMFTASLRDKMRRVHAD